MNREQWQEIDRLFHAALARPAQERAAFLAENCGGDEELRREIEVLIASHQQPKDFIENHAGDLAAEMLAGGGAGVAVGQTVGPYKILELLGAGGMGQVFRATDTRLHRTVAIKILPRDKVSDLERKRRFLQEARAASALNHPNIVTLYDIANDGGMDYLVMEYVEGKSLDRLIAATRLPLPDSVGYAAQIAGALAAAHSAGIVHRDIKPANVIVRPESQVKVLDFGVAKLTEVEEPEVTMTATGAVVGTPAYMSPEQAVGRPVDHRTDIFSLGVMLYEMAAGTRPFTGESHVQMMHAIVETPAPPLAAVPPRLADIVDKALAKDPKERYQNAGDLAVDLRRFLNKTDSHALVATSSAGRARPMRWIVAAIAVVAAAVAALLMFRPEAALDNPLANAKFTRLTDFPGDEVSPALSPDGKFAVFLSDRGETQEVSLTQVGTGRFQRLAGRATSALSTTNRPLGFTGDGSEIWLPGPPAGPRFRLIPLIGGVERPFLEEKTGGAFWSPDGKRMVYFTNVPGDPMFVADHDGSNSRQIFVDRPGMHNHFPAWSPDGRWIYFVHGRFPETNMDIWRIPSTGGQLERLTEFDSYIGYPTPVDSRTVLYIGADRDGSGPWLWAFDVERKAVRRVTFGLERYSSISAASGGHRLIASVANPVATLWSVPILDRIAEESDVKPYAVPEARALMPRFGGTSLFYLSSQGGNDGLWRLDGGQATEIWKGSETALLDPPAVSRDGHHAAVVIRRNGKQNLLLITVDGSQARPLAETLEVRGAAAWSPDGKWIVTGGNDGTGGDGLFKIPVDGGGLPRLTTGTATNPVWSPDGMLIAYTGILVNAVAPLLAVRPDGSAIRLPSIQLPAGGERLQFLGKSLIYMQQRAGSLLEDFWMLDLTTLKTRQLTRLNQSAIMRTFDISPDGKQIVFDRLRNNSDIVLIDLPK